MRVVERGDGWEWCTWSSKTDAVEWYPVLLIEMIGPNTHNPEYNDWVSLDLLTGDVETAFNLPKLGWEKVE